MRSLHPQASRIEEQMYCRVFSLVALTAVLLIQAATFGQQSQVQKVTDFCGLYYAYENDQETLFAALVFSSDGSRSHPRPMMRMLQLNLACILVSSGFLSPGHASRLKVFPFELLASVTPNTRFAADLDVRRSISFLACPIW
jgi:hypothetical protein